MTEGTEKEKKTPLAGRVALVTGASRGVGAETARLLADQGADVVINYRSKERRAREVAEVVEFAGRRALLAQADLADAEAVAAMAERIEEAFGRLDVLILNASGGLEREMPADYAMRLNRDAQIETMERMLPLMSNGGRIVFVTSHLAHFHGEKPVMPEYEPVAASKRAGETALRERTEDLARQGIRLVVVSGDLIDGTITPKLLDRMNPGTIEARRREAGWLPTAHDFAFAIVDAAVDPNLANGATVYVGSTEW
jgi:NAD(P)-dependent dehydrogenase (short-subunit alcohol dehydrogenase family)